MRRAARVRLPPGGKLWIWGLAGVLLCVAFVVHARAWSFVCDDAFISFRYARNLAEHHALVFNLGERVEGYTNFLWVVVLAVGAKLGVDPPSFAATLTTLGAATSLVFVVAWFLTLRPGASEGLPVRLCALLPAAFCVASPEFMVWRSGGLETSFATALTLAALLAWTRGAFTAWGALAAAAVATRPDALVPIAAYCGTSLVLLAVTTPRPPMRIRPLLVGFVVFAVPLVLHLLWRRAYYGAWLPNTWAVKAHGALLRDTWGLAYVRAWGTAVHVLAVAPLALLLRPRHLPLAVMIAAIVLYGYAVGGDFMAYARFYLTATAGFAVLVGWLLADVAALLETRGWRRTAWLPLVIGTAMAAYLGVEASQRWRDDMARDEGWLHGRWEGVAAMNDFARTGLRAGGWMREHLPPSTTITVGAAGAVPYASGLPTIDAYGLVDPQIPNIAKPHRGRGARPGHQLWAPRAYIEARDPDLLCHVGYRGSRRPRSGHAHPAYRRGYAWACIDVTGEAARSTPQYYCCRRPEGRLEGVFEEATR